MPPKSKITREMVVDAALAIIRRGGVEGVTVRAVAEELGCSTQPVMYHFTTVEELKRAAYTAADCLHSDYLLQESPDEDPILSIGLNYIRFAVREPQLFRFLFQSGYSTERNLAEMIDSPQLIPVIGAMVEGAGLTPAQAKDVFLVVALFTHGYASIIANESLELDEAVVAAHLTRAFEGAMMAAMAGGHGSEDELGNEEQPGDAAEASPATEGERA
ncbi:MAG: TetR/AcrR family transcriptional regulator [Eggerthellaceae bacterium]|nr:TetR/AcrR family transcriptional regulator [Eggerthellaceae bacterium]